MSHLPLSLPNGISSRLARPIGRRELLLWIVAGLFANQAIQVLDFGSLSGLGASLANQNYIYWFGCYVVFYRISASDDRVSAENTDWYFAFAMMLSMLLSGFIAYRFAIGFLATVMALYLLLFRSGDRELKAAGVVILALSAHLVWGPILFQFLTPELLRADAALVGGMLKVVRPDIIWTDTTFQTPGSFAISLVGACSSFHDLSTALLACAAATMFMRTNWIRSDVVRIAAAGAAMIFINDARLCLLAWNQANYDFWHGGAGAPLIGFFTTIVLLVIAFWGARPRNSRA
jgi:Transmembrane exosortase (Exosortase_EpsH)